MNGRWACDRSGYCAEYKKPVVREFIIRRGKKFVKFRDHWGSGGSSMTLIWSWTGLVHTVPVEDARAMWKGLWLMGFRKETK
jgi:hypothetical protein